MSDVYTENLADFGFREIKMLRETLHAWVEEGLPETFGRGGVKPAMNRNSGYVFLVNEDYQVAMLNGDALEEFYTLPYSGEEGFLSDLVAEHTPDELHIEDAFFIVNAADMTHHQLQTPWLEWKNGNQPEPG